MIADRIRRLVAIIAGALALGLMLPGLTLSQTGLPPEEFNGPFASWQRLTCTGVDDTAAFQHALDSLGRGNSPVLYIDAGTCRITSTLVLGEGHGGATGVEGVTILGHDPSDTAIAWAGPPGGSMLDLKGVAHSRFGRLTWDGGGSAGSAYIDDWDGKLDYFPTANRHEDETFQNFTPTSIAAILGAASYGTAETTWIRCHFLGPLEAGLFLANFNVLNHWVWDSLFQNVMYGVTNDLSDHPGGAGGFAVNRSTFLDNIADTKITNTSFFSTRWNYSRGSGWHIFSSPIGSAASPWTSQGEVIVDPQHAAFSFGTPGPLGVVDDTFRGGPPTGLISVVEGYASNPGGDIWGIGNTFSNSDPGQYVAGRGQGRTRIVDDQSGVQVDDPGPPDLPPTPAATQRSVFEPQGDDIQAAIDAAVGSGEPRAVVHVPFGNHSVSHPLVIPPDATIQLEGDGLSATRLVWAGSGPGPVLLLQGPTQAVVRDLSIDGKGAADGVRLSNADQPGGQLHVEDVLSNGAVAGVLADGISQTAVDLLDFLTGGTQAGKSAGARAINGSTVHWFNGNSGGSGYLYDVQNGSTLVAQNIYEENSGVMTAIAPNGNGTLVLDSGKLQGAAGSTVDASTFSGTLTLLNIGIENATLTASDNFLGMGVIDTTQGLLDSSASYGNLLSRLGDKGGGSRARAAQIAGIGDATDYMRTHLAALRSAVPKPLADPSPGTTNVRLYRVEISRAAAGLAITNY